MEIQTPTECLAIILFDNNTLPENNLPVPPQPDNPTCRRNSRIGTCDALPLPSLAQKLISPVFDEFQRHYSEEQVVATIFLWVMPVTSLSHFVLGFKTLEKTGLSKSISPIIMSFFKYSLAIITTHPLVYSDAFKIYTLRKKRSVMWLGFPLANFLTRIGENKRWIVGHGVDILSIAFMGGFEGHGKDGWFVNFGLYSLMQIMVFPVGARINFSDLSLFVTIVAGSSRAATSSFKILTSSSAPVLCFLDNRVMKLLPVAAARVNNLFSGLKEKKTMRKFIKYALGMTGTLIFQTFFRLTTFGEVKAFLYLASSWLTNLTLINASEDFGILNFLLGNMVLGSTVSQSGLGVTTWLTYAACLLLHLLSLNFKSMTSQTRGTLPRPSFLFWIFYSCTIFDCLHNLVNQI